MSLITLYKHGDVKIKLNLKRAEQKAEQISIWLIWRLIQTYIVHVVWNHIRFVFHSSAFVVALPLYKGLVGFPTPPLTIFVPLRSFEKVLLLMDSLLCRLQHDANI